MFNRMRMASGLPYSQNGEVWLIDAGDLTSYPGTGTTWANTVQSPSDPSPASAYDFTISGLTFNGTPGGASGGEYFSSGGAGYSQLASNTTFSNSLHKAGAAFGFLWFGRLDANGTRQCLMTTTQSQASFGVGVTLFIETTNKLRFISDNGSASALDVSGLNAIASGDHAIGVSIDASGTGYFYVDGAYSPNAASSNTWSSSYVSPSSANATAPMLLGGNTFGPKAFGSRDAVQVMWDHAPTKAEVDQAFNAYRARFGL